MKGVKSMSIANGSATRFHIEELITQSITGPTKIVLKDGNDLVDTVKKMTLALTTLNKTVTELSTKVKELEDKVNSFETEE